MGPARTRASRGTTFGGFAFASFLVAAASGIALVLPFDVHKPYDSIALILLANPGARFYRSVHYVAAQLFLVLTFLHAWDHLRRGTERRVTAAMWVRVTLLGPIAAFLMLSGFMLKGDAEGMQALRVMTAVIQQVPFVGHPLSLLLFGADPLALQVVYVHHAATATILAWMFTAEHARGVWPKFAPVLGVAAVSALFGLFFSPALHDGLEPLVRGPWYFLGLQEMLHWLRSASWLIAAFAAVLASALIVPRLSPPGAQWLKRGLAATLIAYFILTMFALLARGENWALGLPTRARLTGISYEPLLSTLALAPSSPRDVPTVLNRREGCLYCHRDTTGLSASHRPDGVGCASCHAGSPFSLDKAVAHRGMVRVPGNLGDARRSCGLTACHPGVPERVQASIMSTMSGVISVDRAVFGEAASTRNDLASLGHTPADSHLRQLCASCHLGAPKIAFGPIAQRSRGGGCNACHLAYSNQARQALGRYMGETHGGTSADRSGAARPRLVHPDITLAIDNDRCFGCHSRSGRISTSYEGWQEQSPGAAASDFGLAASDLPKPGTRREESRGRLLDDGRRFVFVQADVHSEKGMLCVDCHNAREVMGDGATHTRKSEHVRIACEDCHAARVRTLPIERLDSESRRILAVTGQPGGASRWKRPWGRSSDPQGLRGPEGPRDTTGSYVVATRAGLDAFLNTFLDERGNPALVSKKTGERLPLRAPAPACIEGGGHARLSCASCHTSWTPTCVRCHTAFTPAASGYDHLTGNETKGAWVEDGSDYRASAPTLGVRVIQAGDRSREVVDTFAPGMILSIQRPGAPNSFERLYARTVPHTTSKGSRSCESCHNDPVSLGYGRGRLEFRATDSNAASPAASASARIQVARNPRRGRWVFTPEGQLSPYDRLPADAWTGFLRSGAGNGSTRQDVRPFTADEQKQILMAGACLTCHRGDSRVMTDAIRDFRAVVRRIGPRCTLPVWN